MHSHEGHRQRLRARFRQEGLDHFDEKHVLELMLFYCLPRKDTNELADVLLKYFGGSIVNVLDATPEELERVPGIGDSVSTFFALRRAVDRYYMIKANRKPTEPLTCAVEYGKSLMPYFRDQRNETVYVLCLDAKCKQLSCLFVGEGSVNSANIPLRRIMEICLNANATSIVLAHNHPGGLAIPSVDDIQTTRRLAQAMATVDINLLDHLIFTDEDFTSLVESGYYRMSDHVLW